LKYTVLILGSCFMIVSWASGSRLSTNIEHLWGKSEHAAGTMKHKLTPQRSIWRGPCIGLMRCIMWYFSIFSIIIGIRTESKGKNYYYYYYYYYYDYDYHHCYNYHLYCHSLFWCSFCTSATPKPVIQVIHWAPSDGFMQLPTWS